MTKPQNLKTSKGLLAPVSAETLVAAALNEHGFLLQQVVVDKLRGKIGQPEDTQDQWQFVASEYPVTAADSSQTKIDLLLRHKRLSEIYMCIECKRPNPRFKKWVFFGHEAGLVEMPDWVGNIETVYLSHRRRSPEEDEDIKHSLQRITSKLDVPFFAYYVEAIVARNRDSQSASSTENIEKAIFQLLKGQSGLVEKFCRSNATGIFKSIPVVVTTAEIIEARFDRQKISEPEAVVDAADVKLIAMDYCAVNYRADDSLAVKTRTPHEQSIGTSDLVNGQIRTVFVVNVVALNKFLNWAGRNLINLNP